MRLSVRQGFYLACLLGLLAVFASLDSGSTPEVTAGPATAQPIDRVPADAALVIHAKVADVWAHPGLLEIRKTYAKDLGDLLKEMEGRFALSPDDVETLTFHFPKMPQGPGDEELFVLQVVTKKPYDRDTIFKGLRKKGEMPKGDVLTLADTKLVVHFTSDRQFTVTHETLLEDFKKGTPAKDGPLADALKIVKEGKATLVFGLDPATLPAELFANAPAEVQPFLPLLKSKAIVLQAGLDKDLRLNARFVAENEEKAIESERAFNLLMKVADDGLTELLKDDKPSEDLKPLLPALADLQKIVAATKATRDKTVASASFTLKADASLLKPVAALLIKPREAAARQRSANNLKQIALAFHNYESTYRILPPAAIVDKKGKPLLSWRVAILPYIEQDNLYKKFKLDEPWDSEHNKKLADVRIATYTLPYGKTKGSETHYRVFVGGGAAFDMIQGTKFDQFTDGLSNTILVYEAAEGTPWTKPDEIEFDPKQDVKKHFRFENGVCNVALADGSVRALAKSIDDKVLRLLIQRDDGQPIPQQ
jgi:hypothetical protein